MADPSPITIERHGLFGIIRGGRPYKAAIEAAGGRWRADGSYKIPMLVSVTNQLKRAGVPLPDVPGPAEGEPWFVPPQEPWLVSPHEHPYVDHPYWPKLYPYQQRSVDFLLGNPFPGALLALSPGLGKTPTTIVAAEMAGVTSVLTLCPKVLIPVWRQEREKWATLPWNNPKQSPLRPWTIVNWEFFLHHLDDYDAYWDLCIIDESILVKTRSTQRYKAIKKLRKKIDRVWLLSGSPISRHVDDLWTQLSLCFPDAFTSYWRFVETYCYSEENVWGGRVVTGSRNVDFPHEFRDLMFVKNQAEVLPDLPDFVEQNIPVELDGAQKKVYDRALNDFVVALEGEDVTIVNRMAQMTRLQQIVSHPRNLDSAYAGNAAKLDALLELLDSGAIATPLLVWTTWRGTAPIVVEALVRHGLRAAHVIGGMSDHADVTIADYKAGKLDALVLSQGVGKHGLTLTNTRTVVYHDKGFGADAWIQSLARVRRIGLDHTFHIINLHSPHTTDDLILDNLGEKAIDIAKVSGSDLASLLRAL